MSLLSKRGTCQSRPLCWGVSPARSQAGQPAALSNDTGPRSTCQGGCLSRQYPLAATHLTRRSRLANAPTIHAAAAASGLRNLATIAPMCFDEACRATADHIFVAAITLPIVVAAAAVAYLLRRPPPLELEQRGIFEDPETGAVLEPQEAGATPERDSNGQLVFRAYSYTPLPVEAGAAGERIRLDVGPIKNRQPRTFVFSRVLPGESQLLVATLPRPLGVVFEYDERRRRIVVAGLTAGGNAEQRRKVAGLNQQLMSSTVAPGDVLRAVTCTNFVYETRALLGAVPPQRHIVLYGVTPKATWSKVCTALRKGEPGDGPVTLVLERPAALVPSGP